MTKEYSKENFIPEKSSEEKKRELMNNILITQKKIKEANINYEYADGELIDYFLYTIKAEQAKLDYLLGKAKLQGITVNIEEKVDFRINSSARKV